MVRASDVRAHLRLRRPRPGGLVHGLAGLGRLARRQPVLLARVNVPYGANLLSNTSGTLIGLVLSPVTRIWGPVAATNVALTLAPGAERLGMLGGATPRGQLEGSRHSCGTGVRLLARHRHLDHVRPCVGLALGRSTRCSSPISTRCSPARSDPLHDGLRAPRPRGRGVLDLARGAGDLRALRRARSVVVAVRAGGMWRGHLPPHRCVVPRHRRGSLAQPSWPIRPGSGSPGRRRCPACSSRSRRWPVSSSGSSSRRPAPPRLPAYSVVRSDGYLGHNGPPVELHGLGRGAPTAPALLRDRRPAPAAGLAVDLPGSGGRSPVPGDRSFLGLFPHHLWPTSGCPGESWRSCRCSDEILPDQLSCGSSPCPWPSCWRSGSTWGTPGSPGPSP